MTPEPGCLVRMRHHAKLGRRRPCDRPVRDGACFIPSAARTNTEVPSTKEPPLPSPSPAQFASHPMLVSLFSKDTSSAFSTEGGFPGHDFVLRWGAPARRIQTWTMPPSGCGERDEADHRCSPPTAFSPHPPALTFPPT